MFSVQNIGLGGDDVMILESEDAVAILFQEFQCKKRDIIIFKCSFLSNLLESAKISMDKFPHVTFFFINSCHVLRKLFEQ